MFQNFAVIVIILLSILTINSSFGRTEHMSSYIDPEGRFEFKYPSKWIPENNFDVNSSSGLKFYPDALHRSQLNEIMHIGIGHRDESLSTPSMNFTTILRLDSALFVEKFTNDLQNFSLLKQPDFSKYEISGYPSLYFEFSFIKSTVPKKGLFVATEVNGSIFYILFSMDQHEFKNVFPVIGKIISSVKLKTI